MTDEIKIIEPEILTGEISEYEADELQIVSNDEIRINYEEARKSITEALETAMVLLADVKVTIQRGSGNMRAIEVGSKLLSSINELSRSLADIHKSTDLGIQAVSNNLTINQTKEEHTYNNADMGKLLQDVKEAIQYGK